DTAGIKEDDSPLKRFIVSTRPCAGWLLLLLPVKSQLQIRWTPQTSLSDLVHGRSLRNTLVHLGRFKFFIDPRCESRPNTHQALMRKLNNRITCKFYVRAGHQE